MSRTRTYGIWLIALATVVTLSTTCRPAVADGAASGGLDFKTTIARVTPSVVRVYAEKTVRSGARRIRLLRQASGVVLTSDGFVVTQNGIILDPDKVHIRGADNVRVPVKVILRDAETDLAFLKVENGARFKPIVLGDSDLVRPGQAVLHVGNPFGLALGRNTDLSVNHGVVTAVHALMATGRSYKGQVIQSDAGFNPGGYGGALVNMKGELIGIAAAVKTSRRTNTDISFAIPVNELKRLLIEARRELEGSHVVASEPSVPTEKPTRERPRPPTQPGKGPGYLGAYILEESTSTRGAYVDKVVPGSPADMAGLRAGDLVTAVDSKTLGNGTELLDVLEKGTEGTVLKLTVERDGVGLEVEVKLGKVPRRVLR